MKITEIRTFRLTPPPHKLQSQPRRAAWVEDAEVANPMSRYPKVKRHRNLWTPRWGQARQSLGTSSLLNGQFCRMLGVAP